LKKLLIISILLLSFTHSSFCFSHLIKREINTNIPANITGTTTVNQTLIHLSESQPNRKVQKWQTHNSKISDRLNRQLKKIVFTKDNLSTAETEKSKTDTIETKICVQISYSNKKQNSANSTSKKNIEKAIKAYGGIITGTNFNQNIIQALMPKNAIISLSTSSAIDSIKLPPHAIVYDNNYTTEALGDINADQWHAAGIYGQNTKIGIIDVGFIGYKALKGIDLPSEITAKNFVDGETENQIESGSVHGTACAEIVHDIAPAATLYLAKIYSDIDLQEAANWLQNNNIDIITTSLGFYNMTCGDGSGELADTVTRAYNAGILWTTAAGNDRQRHWGGLFSDPDNNGMHNFNGNQEINFFGPGDGSAYLVNPNLKYSIFARWSDWDNVDQDYDIYVYRWDGNSWGSPISSSVNIQDGSLGQTPTEVAEFTTSGEPTAYGFIIYHSFAVNKTVNFEIFIPYAPRLDETVPNRSLPNLADSPKAITVAAADAGSLIIQEYSSMGPTNGSGGCLNGGINKPDITSYTNVSTNSYGTLNFSGTSASTPHVAGAAALILSQNPSFTPSQIQDYLQNQAIDISSNGFDFSSGWGRLHLDDQELPICNPPVSIIIPENSGSGSFQISWSPSATDDVTYLLEEATNNSFSENLHTVYSGNKLFADLSNKSEGKYFYRVKAIRNQYNDSSWTIGSNPCNVSYELSKDTFWLGYSVDWNDPGNWSITMCPDINTEVVISNSPEGGYNPEIFISDSTAKKIKLSGKLTISNGSLIISSFSE